MKAALLFLSALTGFLSFAQDSVYFAHAGEAYRLYQQGDYLQSAKKYSDAFAANGWKGTGTDRYNAACSWALAGVADSAFFQLFRVAEKMNYANLRHISTDTDLRSLHADPRWDELLGLVRQNKEKAEINFDKPLVAMLDSIYASDQIYRQQISEIAEQHGWESDEVKALWKVAGEQDSLNLIQIRRLLDTRGWLGVDVIGEQGNATLFLVIQHSDQQTQETYLPMMREAVAKGNARASQLALLEDRVALGQGKKQLYGSQIGRNVKTGEFYVQPLEDPDNVDKRRAEMGLGPMQEYTGNWNLTWDTEAYKKQLPKIEKIERKQQKAWEKEQKKEAKRHN